MRRVLWIRPKVPSLPWIRLGGVARALFSNHVPWDSGDIVLTALCRSPKQYEALPEWLHGCRLAYAIANSAKLSSHGHNMSDRE